MTDHLSGSFLLLMKANLNIAGNPLTHGSHVKLSCSSVTHMNIVTIRYDTTDVGPEWHTLSGVKSSWFIVLPHWNHIPPLLSNYVTMLCLGPRSSPFQGQNNSTAVPESGHQGGAHHGAGSARVCPALLTVPSPLTPTALCICSRSVCGCVERLQFSLNSLWLSIDFCSVKLSSKTCSYVTDGATSSTYVCVVNIH